MATDYLFGDLFEDSASERDADGDRNEDRGPRAEKPQAEEKRADEKQPAHGPSDTSRPAADTPVVHSVSELTQQIKGNLESGFRSVWVSGEISNFKHHGSGHMYLSLKDAGAQIRAVVWRSTNARFRFRPRDGMEVVARGAITVYDRRGDYQLVIQKLEPRGVGALQLAFEQLKQRLAAEGVFAVERKRPLPVFPRTVALVTSPSGAAVRDMIRVAVRRFPRVHLVVVPVLVQGEEAAPDVARGVELAGRATGADVILVGRGGGSLEDLWAFNTEIVARAILASPVPVVSAVGHEVDTTIADFVADVRAPTPSAAAEIAIPELAAIERTLRRIEGALTQRLVDRVASARDRLRDRGRLLAARHPIDWVRRHQQRLDELAVRLRRPIEEVKLWRSRFKDLARRLRTPAERVARARERLDDRGYRLDAAFRRRWREGRERVEVAGAQMHALSPLRILERGYSITTLADDTRPLVAVDDLEPGTRVTSRLRDGFVTSVVEDVRREADDRRKGEAADGREET